MHLNAPGYALVVIPLLYVGVWRLSVSDGEEHPHEHTLACVGALAILWILVSAVTAYAA
jgi:hypothetical protein